ncbi:MAG: malonic semialdehyde reductase [Pseudomonadota bacterium]
MSTEAPVDTEMQDRDAQQAVRDLRETIREAHPDTIKLLITEARTHYGWQDKPVADETLRALYDIAKMAPTSMNQQPMRLVFVRSPEAKARLEPHLAEGNKAKVKAAPVTVIIGNDVEFYERLPELFPPAPNAKDMFSGSAAGAEVSAFRNGTIQAAYLLIAARAVGLDVGPMSGFSNEGVDGAFFSGTTIKSNFICNLGYGDETRIYRRLPRLPFDEVAQII